MGEAATLQWVEVNPWSQQVQKMLKKSEGESRERIALLSLLLERRREATDSGGRLRLWGSCGIREGRRARQAKTSRTDIICRLFDDGGHSDWCKVIYCSFDLHFRVAYF